MICAASLLSALPTINDNIDDPNMIVYLNADEGGLMDEIWYYYSNQKRDSFQWSIDYGLEMILLSDLAHILFSKVIDFTPGTFVLILRWIHLLAWIGALVVLWFFVGRHFGKGWQQVLVVSLLAVRPAFDYFSNSLKPEPVVLLFMIIGLDFALRMIEEPSRRNLLIAVLCAAVAFYVKFAGIFLLPAIIAAMYFREGNKGAGIKYSWLLELGIGLVLVVLPFLFVFFYIRKTTGLTFYQDFGLFNTISMYKIILLSIIAGIIFIALGIVLFVFTKSTKPAFKKIVQKITPINSCIFVVVGLFSIFLILLGLRWIGSPGVFLDTYSFNLLDYTGVFAIQNNVGSNLLQAYLSTVAYKLVSFDMIMFVLFLFYLMMEVIFRRQSLAWDTARFYKRLCLVIFLVPGFLSIFTMGRFAQHHMLPFFVVMVTLSVQGIYIFREHFKKEKVVVYVVTAVIALLLAFDFILNGSELANLRMQRIYARKDIAHDIKEWWRENIPAEAKIVSEHYVYSYIPSFHKNIKVVGWSTQDRVAELRKLVEKYRPQYIYYNAKLEDIGVEMKLVRSFSSEDREYVQQGKDKYFIYEVIN